MKFALFYHSILSDWNHGNAHFLRGIASELLARGHEVKVFEPEEAWSLKNLLAECGTGAIREFHQAYPSLNSHRFNSEALDLDEALDGADVVVVHEWNEPALIKRIGRHRGGHRYRLYFHDTHHRMITDFKAMSRLELSNYDGVLAYGNVLRDLYERSGRVAQTWTWHEAADTRVFRPLRFSGTQGDLVWIGNWGDDERTAELEEFFIRPCRELSLKARAHGVRYPEHARSLLAEAGIDYAGWLPNFKAPQEFAAHKLTLHIPRRPYVAALPGIPTIRPFEALACGIPLVCSPWQDVEGLFSPGLDFLIARNGQEMTRHLRALVNDPDLRRELAAHGLQTIRSRHTCGHRVEELLAIDDEVRGPAKDSATVSSQTPATRL
jgi:spore maturation protein CgeB